MYLEIPYKNKDHGPIIWSFPRPWIKTIFIHFRFPWKNALKIGIHYFIPHSHSIPNICTCIFEYIVDNLPYIPGNVVGSRQFFPTLLGHGYYGEIIWLKKNQYTGWAHKKILPLPSPSLSLISTKQTRNWGLH